MYCIKCHDVETRVVDSRWLPPNQVRRRRECPNCLKRFTTYEEVSVYYPKILKRDGSVEPFDINKIRRGILTALEKRPNAHEISETLIKKVVHDITREGSREITSSYIGDAIMGHLLVMDLIAYVRFASVYKSFETLDVFHKFIDEVRKEMEMKNEKK